MLHRSAFVLLCSTMGGCAVEGEGAVGSLEQAYGEQQSGYPSPAERALLMAANRARSDPSTVKGAQSTIYPPQAPLAANYNLERSSRFHTMTLAYGHAPLVHNSPCTLLTNVATSGCDGKPACACSGGTTCNTCTASSCTAGTAWNTRVSYFYSAGPSGEVAAAGYGDPWSAMDGWVDEPAGADGHRQIIDSGSNYSVGMGYTASPTGACWGTFYVGDFATARPGVPEISCSSAKPYTGAAGTFRVYATWADPAHGAPASLYAVVDGSCKALAKELGSPTLNATYYVDVPLTAGCHAVYVAGKDAAGTYSRYPSTTAYTISVTPNAGCADQTTQATADCEVAGGVDLAAPIDLTVAAADLTVVKDLTVATADLVAAPKDLASGPVDLATASKDSATGGGDLSTGGKDLSTGASDLTTGAVDLAGALSSDAASGVDLASTDDAAMADASAPSSDAASTGVVDSLAAVVDASAGGDAAAGGTSVAGGCACHVGAHAPLDGGAPLVLGSLVGFVALLRRRRAA